MACMNRRHGERSEAIQQGLHRSVPSRPSASQLKASFMTRSWRKSAMTLAGGF